ncbi:MAG: protein kinase domain-containing protein [Gemmatimonadaceae bacterium]
MTHPEHGGLPDDLLRALAGHYEIERPLGAGGMGTVYLARDRTLDRLVAIKVVAPELTTSSVIRERFLQEARTIARLRHPNIVDVHSAGEAGGLLYFVMEYVPGESLRDRMDRDQRVDGPEALTILRDLARALAYAHERGIVHRDVKPDNILLDRESGCSMLTDFGVARALSSDDERLTRTGFVLGSPRYMSPEQAAGDRELDGKSDVYSLALVGYEMFAGGPAVSGTGAQAIILQQLTQSPAPLDTRSETVPPVISDLIGRALSKDPAERPAAAEMAAVIDDVITGERVAATPTLSGARRRRPRSRGAIAAAAIGAVLLVALGGALVARGRDSTPDGIDPRRSYLVTPFVNVRNDPQVDWLREGSVNMLTLDFAQWKDLEVVDYEHTLDLLRDADIAEGARVGLEDARRLARRAGVWSVVMGQIDATRDSLLVNATVYDVATGKRVEDAHASAAPGTDPRPLYDALARDLLNIVGAPTASLNLSASTTQSVEAYRAYLAGARALNAWRLPEADSLLARASAIDTTFALAFYKRALTLGWRGSADTAQFAAVRHATEHADRLPVRERSLLFAYSDLVRSLHPGPDIPPARLDTLFRSAQQKYESIVARTPNDAEAWYGLGDSYYHHRSSDQRLTVRNWSQAWRAFNRTLALDSSFHLAYSHKLDIEREASRLGSGLLLAGDSLVLLDSTALLSIGNARMNQLRASAKALAVRDAHGWVAADASPQAYQALVNAFIDAGFVDSAAIAVADAQRRPVSRSPVLPYILAAAQANSDPHLALRTLRQAMIDFPAESIAVFDGNDRFWYVLSAGDAALASGSVTDLHKVVGVATKVSPKMPGRPDIPSSLAVGAWVADAELALGLPTAATRARADSAIRYLDRMQGPEGETFRAAAQSLPYVAYLATHDTSYVATLRRWSKFAGTLPEIDALAALDRGDRETAARATRLFPSPDSMRAVSALFNTMRWVARAEALDRLGDARRAVTYLDVLDPVRLSRASVVDPSLALYARSILASGVLYEKIGDKARAVAAYQRFLDMWRDADPALDPQRRLARDGLARLGGEVPTEPTR